MDEQQANNEGAIELNKSQFGREAAKYVTSRIHSNQEDLNFVLKIINPQDYWECLDIATGAGHLAHIIAQSTKHVIASDITPQMLNETAKLAEDKKISNISFEEIDVHSIPYEDNKFDLVTSRIAPHHFYDISLAISEMIRVTKPGGFVFIEDTVAPENVIAGKLFNKIEILRDPSHKNDLSESEWKNIFTSNDCEIVSITKREKEWPLKWWTERMSTPSNNVEKIIHLLENNHYQFKDEIGIIQLTKDYDQNWPLDRKIESWKLIPNNIYLLARKE
ncbi:MAG: class I SAM-dependent methyltransferase [Candidatus Heimdallarchaeota archaeon]